MQILDNFYVISPTHSSKGVQPISKLLSLELQCVCDMTIVQNTNSGIVSGDYISGHDILFI